MSDPVTNVEIEDVLSSIRRLVTDGEKDRPRKAEPAEGETAWVEPSADRLVLTPAFRVEDAAPAPVAAPEATSEIATEVEDEVPVPDSESGIAAENEPEDKQEIETQEVSAELNEEPAPETKQETQQDSRSLLEETIAELEAAVADDAAEWEPDGSEELPLVSSWPGFEPDEIADAEIAPEPETEAKAEPEPDTETAPEAETHSEPEIAASQEDAANMANMDSEATTPEPEAEEAPQVTAEAAPNIVQDTAEIVEEPPNDDLTAYLEDESILDEAMLRDLVAEIVREELQGPMGTRITRNVRKLVRREINLILNSQEFN